MSSEDKKPTEIRKEREKEARRDAILNAAANVFSVKGFHDATIDEIAAEAELAKGTLYNYYRDKQDLFVSLLRWGSEQFIDLLVDSIGRFDSLTAFISHVLSFTVNGMLEHKYLTKTLLSVGSHISDTLREELFADLKKWHTEVPHILAEAMAQLPETKVLPMEERLVGARMMLAAAKIMFMARVADDTEADPGPDEIDIYTRFLCRALGTERISCE